MPELTILSRSERHKAIVGDTAVTYYRATVSSAGVVTWQAARHTEFTMPRHVMLDVVRHIVNTPSIKPGR